MTVIPSLRKGLAGRLIDASNKRGATDLAEVAPIRGGLCVQFTLLLSHLKKPLTKEQCGLSHAHDFNTLSVERYLVFCGGLMV